MKLTVPTLLGTGRLLNEASDFMAPRRDNARFY